MAIESRWQILFVGLIVISGIVATAGKSLNDLHTHVLDLFNTGFVFGVLTTAVYLYVRNVGSDPSSRVVRFVRTAPWMTVAMLGVIVIAFAEWPIGDTGFWTTTGAAVVLTATFVFIAMQRDLETVVTYTIIAVWTVIYVGGLVYVSVSGKSPVPLFALGAGFLLLLCVVIALGAWLEYDKFRAHPSNSTAWDLLTSGLTELFLLLVITLQTVMIFGVSGIWQLVPLVVGGGGVIASVLLVGGPEAARQALAWRLRGRKEEDLVVR